MSKRGDQDHDDLYDGKQPQTASIPLLVARKTGEVGDNDVKLKPELAMEGLLLWRVLEFALTDEHDYACFTVVNKEWNQTVKALVPPIMFQMKAVVDRQGSISTNDLRLLNTVLHSLETRTSRLYRQVDPNATGDISWPHLQPQFNLLIQQFVYKASSNGMKQNVYDLVRNYLQDLSAKTAQKMTELLDQKEGTPQGILEGLVECWSTWDGIVYIVTGLTCHLKYYIKFRRIQPIYEHAQSCLAKELCLKTLKERSSIERVLQHVFTNVDTFSHALLKQAYQAAETLASFYSVTQQELFVAGLGRVQEIYLQTKVVMEERIKPKWQEAKATQNGQENSKDIKGKNPEIMVNFPDGTKVAITIHFVESSGLLKNLHLRHGESITWDTDNHIGPFRKAQEFYVMDEQTPMTAIATPLRSFDPAVIFGEQYAHFASSLENLELIQMINFANLLQLYKFAELCTLQLIILIKGMSAAERRAFLNMASEEDGQLKLAIWQFVAV